MPGSSAVNRYCSHGARAPAAGWMIAAGVQLPTCIHLPRQHLTPRPPSVRLSFAVVDLQPRTGTGRSTTFRWRCCVCCWRDALRRPQARHRGAAEGGAGRGGLHCAACTSSCRPAQRALLGWTLHATVPACFANQNQTHRKFCTPTQASTLSMQTAWWKSQGRWQTPSAM